MVHSLLAGRWALTQIEGWPQEAPRPALLRLDPEGSGALSLGSLRADIDYRPVGRQRRAGLEFSWLGDDGGQQLLGRGWAVLEGANQLQGRLFVHRGLEVAFTATRSSE